MLLFWSCTDQWLLFSTIRSKLKSNASDSAARRCSEQRLDLTCADAAEPVLPAAPLLHGAGADAGAEPWYKTIVKLMQGRNRTSTHTCEHRASGLSALALPVVTSTSSYLVDPASSHMLVLKIKPCMSKYKHLYRETANGSLKQLWFI